MPGTMTPPDDMWYDPTHQTGDYSYYENLKKVKGADYTSLFAGTAEGAPWPGTATGETPEGTLWQNVVAGLWLPAFIPEGYDGHTEGHPSVVIYASLVVPGVLDAIGPANSSPEVDQERWNKACHLAIDVASSTGSAYAQDVE